MEKDVIRKRYLSDNKRYADLEKVQKDAAYREELFQEYGLI